MIIKSWESNKNAECAMSMQNPDIVQVLYLESTVFLAQQACHLYVIWIV